MKFIRVFALTFTVLILVACDPVPIVDRLGVTMSASDTPVVLFESCPGELVKTVSLIDAKGELGDEDDEVLWRITSEEGSEVMSFPAGTTPSEFEEEMALSGELQGETVLTVQVTTSEDSVTAAAFQLDTIDDKSVTTASAKLPRDTFQSNAESSC